jgi:2-methylcitrate dehydratase PrpD
VTSVASEADRATVARGDLVAELAAWASGMTFADIPPATVALARSQLISSLASVRASRGHSLGRAWETAYGPPLSDDPKQVAYVLAGLSMCLEFDEVGYSGHPSASCVMVAVAYAAREGLNGESLLSTIVVANELSLRFQAATLLGAFFRGQSATYTHLVGAVGARLRACGASQPVWGHALGLALSVLPVPVEDAFLSSDAKMFVAATPVRMGLDACDAAFAGICGPSGILEGERGVLRKLADVPLPEILVAGLGRRWHTDTLSFKRYPGSAYLQTAYECAERLFVRMGPFDPSDIAFVRVDASLLTWLLQEKVGPFLRAADTPVSTLTFAMGYGIGTILLTGGLSTRDYEAEAVRDLRRWDLASKVEVVHDMEQSLRMVAATVPLGEALRQAGDRALLLPSIAAFGDDAREVIAGLGPPAETFERASMAMGAQVHVRLRNGIEYMEQLERGTGMAGPDTRRRHAELAAQKFSASGGPGAILSALQRVQDLEPGHLQEVVNGAIHMGT